MNHQPDANAQEASELLALYADVVPPEVVQEWCESGAESPEKPMTSEEALHLFELLAEVWMLTAHLTEIGYITEPRPDLNTSMTSHHTNPDVPSRPRAF